MANSTRSFTRQRMVRSIAVTSRTNIVSIARSEEEEIRYQVMFGLKNTDLGNILRSCMVFNEHTTEYHGNMIPCVKAAAAVIGIHEMTLRKVLCASPARAETGYGRVTGYTGIAGTTRHKVLDYIAKSAIEIHLAVQRRQRARAIEHQPTRSRPVARRIVRQASSRRRAA